jgi:hypothetical protein
MGKEETIRRCAFCGKKIRLPETYLLADGPTSDTVMTACRVCYIRKSLEIREAVRREIEEGPAP